MKKSFIYNHIYVYRILMNALYLFKYKQRFKDIISQISERDKNILELCFGDIYIADECRKRKIEWTGLDINDNFVKFAIKNGFDAKRNDLLKVETLPTADVCIISGSLYHFYNEIENVFSKMLDAAPKILISEPIINLSSKKGIIGFISKKLTNAGNGEENFRFDKKSIIEKLDKYSKKLNFTYKIISIKRDILIEISNERN